MKGKILKAITFLTVIGLIFAIVRNSVPVTTSENAGSINGQDPAGMTVIATVSGWRDRVHSYGTQLGRHLGPGNEEQKWQFHDVNNEYKNLYCVQSGTAHADTYYMYDIYDLDDDTIRYYFGDVDHYHHFLYIMENMYLIGKSGNDKTDMENALIAKLNESENVSNMRDIYNGMISELNDTYSNIGASSGNGNVNFELWRRGYRTGNYVTLNGGDNFMNVIQSYMLQAYIIQKSGTYEQNPISNNKLNVNFESFTRAYGVYGQFGADSNTYKFTQALLKYLENGYNSETYNVNKYKNFNSNDTYINKSSADHNESEKKMGPFTVVNPNGHKVNVSSVKYGNTDLAYTVVNAAGEEINLSNATEGTEFFVKYTDEIEGTNDLTVNFSFDFGEVPTARIFIPNYRNNQNQLMVNADRSHQSKNDQWVKRIDISKPDIALKKYITAVNGTAVASRLDSIDLTPLANKTDTNAIYNMNKTPVTTKIGDTVTYAIQIFNEGAVAGTASEIVDHLPSYLTFVRAYADGFDNIENIGLDQDVKLRNPFTANIPAYENTDTEATYRAKSQIIYVDCKVEMPIRKTDYIYTNMAEITEYRLERGTDVDSSPSNWTINTSDRESPTWQDYSNNHNDWLDDGFHDFGGQEDDDDFDKVKVQTLDLALTKRIEGKLVGEEGNKTEEFLVPEGTTENKSKIQISGYDAVKNNEQPDLNYNMNKKVAKVTRGDQLVSVITVYNEGHIDGTVRMITDYLPAGLNFNQAESERLNGSNIEFTYNSYERSVDIKINSATGTGVKLNSLDNYTDDCDKVEVRLVTDVSQTANGRLYNHAEITDYGYEGNDGSYYRAVWPGVDKDSHIEWQRDNLIRTHIHNYENQEADSTKDLTNILKNVLQYQDDDDVDCVEVDYNPSFDLALRKFIYKVEREYDNYYGVKDNTVYDDRVPMLDDRSLNELNNCETAAYYHDKVRVTAETGNIVTYRIRVYNEGKDKDYFGRATEITDYLPDGLEFVELEAGNDSGWSATQDGNKIVLSYTGSKILPTDSIEELVKIKNGESNKDEHGFYQEVGIKCRVTASSVESNPGYITNRAAITGDEAYDRVYSDEEHYTLEVVPDAEDRDSNPTELRDPKLPMWYTLTVNNENTPEEYYPGQQDDDDFDTLIVDNYSLTILKTDGDTILPGVKFKVYKYGYSLKSEVLNLTELTDVEDELELTGESTYVANMPVVNTKTDMYIIKEIEPLSGFYNPFENKYIRIGFTPFNHGLTTIIGLADFKVFEDNGDDNYKNDTAISSSDPIYNYLSVDRERNHVDLTISNPEKEKEGNYDIYVTKKGADGVQLGGVEFDAQGYINGTLMDIPATGEKLVSSANDYVKLIPSSLQAADGTIKIDPDAYETADYFTLTEKAIQADAKDSNGNDVNGRYYLGLQDKEIKITVNKAEIEQDTKYVYAPSSISMTIDGNAAERISDTEYRYVDSTTGAEVNVVLNTVSKSIFVSVTNPKVTSEGKYNVNLVKYKSNSSSAVGGVQFTASAVIDGTAETIADSTNPIVTSSRGTVVVKSDAQMSETNIATDDVYTLSEISVGDNTDIYNGLPGDIVLTVKKTTDTTDPAVTKLLVDEIQLSVNGQPATQDSKTRSIINLDNGSYVHAQYSSYSGTVILTVCDPVKTGTFDLNLVKTKDVDEDEDGNKDPLQGAVFKVTINDGTRDIVSQANLTTGIDGRIPTIENIDIAAAGLTYTVKVEETSTPAGYVGLLTPITFTATSQADGATYKLVPVAETAIGNAATVTVNEGEILVKAENRKEPEIHKGVKTITNQSSGYDKDEIQTWVIQSTIPKGIADYTKYVITDVMDPDITNSYNKRIEFIDEEHPENNVKVKYVGADSYLTNGTDYRVVFNRMSKELAIEFINGSFEGGKSLTEGSTLEITYNTKFALNVNGSIKGLNESIPNQATLIFNRDGVKQSERPEVHTGGVGVFKYDNTTDPAVALKGAHFKIARSQAEAAAGTFIKRRDASGAETDVDLEAVTNDEGRARFEGLEFGEDADGIAANKVTDPITGAEVYKYDWSNASTKYYIVETVVPDGYVAVSTPIEVTVKASNYDDVDLTEFHRVGNTPIAYEGAYNVRIVKNGKAADGTLTALQGVKFNATRSVNGNAAETLTVADTDANGATAVGDAVTIDTNKTSDDDVDTYVISEVSVPATSEYYIGLDKDITLNIKKQSVTSQDGTTVTNSVKSVEMVIDGVTVTKESDTKSTATFTVDGQNLDIAVEYSNGTITLTLENPQKGGAFELNVYKIIKGASTITPLTGAGFKVSVKKGNDTLIDGNGVALDGTHEYTVDSNGKISISGVNIAGPGEIYSVTITESTVPNGYIGVNAPIQFTATSVVNGTTLGLTNEDKEISDDVLATIGNDAIDVYVSNKPQPVIHKGVKTVENQDSGYDGNEAQTWVINSTVPAGMEAYTKYIVKDTIDPDKAVQDKRIEFAGLDTVNVKVKGASENLTVNEDYLVAFDDTTKTLKVSFIEGDFKAGQDLTTGSVLEITYQTKFTRDVEGNLKGINQAIPNQAKLTFNHANTVDVEKESERPEVHTGGFGVFKYDSKTGEALENAHFKITRDSSEAAKAVRAILNKDEATLATVQFVKDANTNADVELVTGSNGRAKYEGLEFGKDAQKPGAEPTNEGVGGSPVYKYDWTKAESTYYLVETVAPEGYDILTEAKAVAVKADNYEELDLTEYFRVANNSVVYDLALRKFITKVDDKDINSRIPVVTLTDEFKAGTATTAKYEHTKEPVVVQQGNIVTYTIRIYNEGPHDAFASLVKDDIPDGVEFVKYTEGDGSVNDVYGWKLVDAYNNVVDNADDAKFIVTDYLSAAKGTINDGVNSNLIKAYDGSRNELDYRDVKVQFKVTEPNTSERILTNYAQISEMQDSEGRTINDRDRDSTPDKWIEGEDDQDVEHIKLLYFDLALRKWVTKAIVTQDGKETVFETGHKAEDDPEDVVKVDLKKSKLDNVVVKFEYQIRITNEGKIGGWCEEIKDHIPDGLTFDQADNTIWTVVDDKTITTDALKGVYLEPGQSAEVPVILRWENSATNLGIKVNVAEISKDRNEYGVPDVDSTPDNYKWGEDDIDDAPVMLAVKTGNEALGFVAIVMVTLTIVAVGVVSIKKLDD